VPQELLPSKCKALDSNLSSSKKEKQTKNQTGCRQALFIYLFCIFDLHFLFKYNNLLRE
jgi:hypothetical protein